MITRKILFIIFLCTAQLSFSQYNEDWEEAVVYLKDGSVLNGEARMSMPSSRNISGGNENLRFTEGRKKPIVTVKSKDIDSIIFQLDYRTKVSGKKVNRKRSAKFVTFIKNEKLTKFGFAELIIDGELRLLSRTVSTHNSTTAMGGIQIRKFEQKLIQLKDNVALEMISDIGMKSFKRRAKVYFQDCPILVNKIESKTFKSDDLKAIVNFYNDNCAK